LGCGQPRRRGRQLAGSVAARSINPEHDLWAPHAEEGATLGGIFSANVLAREEPQLKSLMDVLYAPDESEQGMDLSVGYRGRPHIGSAAILSRAEQDVPFWRSLRETLRRAQGGQEVRVFLIGSVFGGTGLRVSDPGPHLARHGPQLDRRGVQRPHRRGADAAVLRLRSAPDDSTNVARPEHLLRQSRAALKYYHDLFRRETVFDETLPDGVESRPSSSATTRRQQQPGQPAAPPELIAARRRCASSIPREPGRRVRRIRPSSAHARRRTPSAGTTSRPSRRPGGGALRKGGSAAPLLCGVAQHHPPLAQVQTVRRGSWYNRQGCKVKYDRAETVQNLEALDDVVERVLEWAAGVQLFATTAEFGPPGVPRFNLWDVSPMATFSPRIDPANDRTRPVTLRPPLTDGVAALAAYRRIVSARDEVSQPPDQGALFNEINVTARPGAHEGLGRIVAAVHHAARLTGAAPTGRTAR
jgi:hypothetical protein